jgi:hypothetical protein
MGFLKALIHIIRLKTFYVTSLLLSFLSVSLPDPPNLLSDIYLLVLLNCIKMLYR